MNQKPYNNAVSDALKKLQNVAVGVTISRKSTKSESPKSSDDDIDDDDDDDDHEMIEFDELEERDDDSSDVDFIPDKTKKKAAATRTRKSSAKIVVVNVESPPVYVCLMCRERFTSFEPLKDHMKNSTQCKEKYLKCDICSKVFDTKKGLQQHGQTHRDKSTTVCEQCGRQFSNQFNLENHKSSKHDISDYNVSEHGSIYRCKLCDDQFTNRKDLYDHISNHSKEPTPVLCDCCGRSFKSAEALRSHRRIHQDIRPFACYACPKRFRSRLQMTQHFHVHTGNTRIPHPFH